MTTTHDRLRTTVSFRRTTVAGRRRRGRERLRDTCFSQHFELSPVLACARCRTVIRECCVRRPSQKIPSLSLRDLYVRIRVPSSSYARVFSVRPCRPSVRVRVAVTTYIPHTARSQPLSRADPGITASARCRALKPVVIRSVYRHHHHHRHRHRSSSARGIPTVTS